MKKANVEELVTEWVEEYLLTSHQQTGKIRELVDVEFVKEGPHWVLRIFLDKPNGIDIEDCQEVSTALSQRLDDEDPIPQAYSLEVSSPGLERPLKKIEDFQRFSGERVQIKTYRAEAGRKKFVGVLLGLADDNVELELDDEKIKIPWDNIAKANLFPEF